MFIPAQQAAFGKNHPAERLRPNHGAQSGTLPGRRLLLIAAMLSVIMAATDARARQMSDAATQAIKNEAIELIGKLDRLEQKLLYPDHSRVSIFVSVAADSPALPASITLRINDDVIASHVYTEAERSALRAGGIQRVFTGNVNMGQQELKVSLKKTLKNGGSQRQDIIYRFNKDEQAEYIEISLDSRKPHVAVTSRR